MDGDDIVFTAFPYFDGVNYYTLDFVLEYLDDAYGLNTNSTMDR